MEWLLFESRLMWRQVFNKRIVEPEFRIVQFLNEIQDYESECDWSHSQTLSFQKLGLQNSPQTPDKLFTSYDITFNFCSKTFLQVSKVTDQ